ncbi:MULTISPECIES: NAD(P)H-dependent oxidoreductase [Flavobacteriaceae]|uniref:Glutathione-regulated potassium-efflux system ancillary protein KefF n=1 Tax=Arenibacter algicola TaxID=616991 RepID=A0A221V4E1_9FLAO|nr:NAD(P)H-dependent oxidoreductase [Arenibacter algicola]ASO08433.1 glutathione-regulated potassium-efflux system ancillary protein KefF [Arenibacter algicola]|tara:strand:+ start:7215 stop:7988 length:774 start_codon:yes stop_codon:yes gene_type:complete
MNILIVYAHPEPKSLNGSIKDFYFDYFNAQGNQVKVSDLYAMNWKAVADGNDFIEYNEKERLNYMQSSGAAFANKTQTQDIGHEQEKLLWANFIIFQFPLWWFGMPAIMKGWVDRVFAFGFAYGTGKYGGKYWGNRYGDGTLKGKKAMLSVTIGGRKPQYEETGINGHIDDLLFPIQHGMLWYAGISVIPPEVLYQAHSISENELKIYLEKLKTKLDSLEDYPVVPYRFQNHGDYNDQQQLKPEKQNGKTGFSIHLK